jgi:hypothetical protein
VGHDHRSGQNAKFSGASNLQPAVLYFLRYPEPNRMAETMIMAKSGVAFGFLERLTGKTLCKNCR